MIWNESDERAHLEDSLRNGEFEMGIWEMLNNQWEEVSRSKQEKHPTEKVFYSEERQAAKVAATGLTLDYIERLESIARAAYLYWGCIDDPESLPGQRNAAGTLYEALLTVDCMDESASPSILRHEDNRSI